MARISPICRTWFILSGLFLSMLSFAQVSGSTTGAQTHAAARVRLEGQLQIRVEDFKEQGRLFYSLKLPNGKVVPLQFVKNPPSKFLTGDHVRVDGQLTDGNVVLYSGSTDLTSTATSTSSSATGPLPNTFGQQSTLVMLVNFQDSAVEPYTVADAQNAYSGKVSDFIAENSYGQTSLNATVVGWYTIPDSVTTCNMTQIASDAQSAASAAGVNLASYTRYVYAFPYNSVCGWAGSSYVGGNPSESWINGNSLNIHTIDHELGHAFGLWHSHQLDCGTSATIGSSCNTVEYGDLLDDMGVSQTVVPHYNAFQKERLGWLNYGVSPTIQTVQSSGTYIISPYETSGTGANALKILKSTDPTTGAKTWYYIEVRQPIGFDAFLTNGTCTFCYTQNETTGVVFHLGTDGNGNSGELLDMTPATPTSGFYYDPALVVGQSFQDSSAGLSITPTAVDGSGATIQITLNGCMPANPTVSLTPSLSQSVAPGTAVAFTATVTNNDSSSCAPASFSLGDLLPSGWSGTWNTGPLSLSPGKSGSGTLTVISPASTTDGSYSINVVATNASVSTDQGSAVGTYVVSAPKSLTVAVTTNQSTYQPGQTVSIAVLVTSGTSVVPGTAVTATITPPGGKLITLKATTGSNGAATLVYKLPRRATVGTYKVGATASGGTVSGASSIAAASTSFTVQ